MAENAKHAMRNIASGQGMPVSFCKDVLRLITRLRSVELCRTYGCARGRLLIGAAALDLDGTLTKGQIMPLTNGPILPLMAPVNHINAVFA